MPRRASARTAAQNLVPVQSETPSALIPPQSLPENLVILRKQWKWAAFSQFFFTFSPLFNMDDVTLKDVEDDLYLGSSLVIPRIIVRLLYTLSYDRKVNLNNWQTTLRRQYNKRDPAANPIGPEPIKDEADSVASPEPESTKMEEDVDETSTREHSVSVQKNEVKSEDGSVPPATRKPTAEESIEEPPSDDAPEQESRDWMSLSMLEKLDSLHLLTEWQFQSPHRVRTLMKTEDDQASWRIEPIGYDAKRNAYWLIGADRLWVQRVPPKPPRPPPKNTLKRKRAADTKTQTKTSSPSKRPRLQTTSATKKSKAAARTSEPTSGRHGRAAKDQAKIKLDQQAKQLAELNRQASLLDSSPNRRSSVRGAASLSKAGPPSPSSRLSSSRTTRASASARPLGTRLSSRLRGSLDDEWQAIPNEWLNDEDEDGYESDSKGKKKVRGKFPTPPRSLAGSSISELTELSEEREEEEKEEEENEKEEEEKEDEEDEKEDEEDEKENEEEESKVEKAAEPERPILEQKKTQDQSSANFVEWETIAVTLNDWENVAERWQNATHYSEKSLYKILTKHIIPIITEELREIEAKLQEIENQRQKEEAINHRKRSSRLAIKESEREEARLAAKKKADESEKMSRAKRLEARQQKEEAERARRESAREQRMKEREAKDEQEAREAEEKERKEKEKVETTTKSRPQRGSKARPNYADHDMSDEMPVQLHHPSSSNASSFNGSARASTRGSRTPAGDDWELDCEICLRRGINLDDGLPLMCCGSCAKWQHIPCHDRADVQAGRPRRNWDQVDFVCRQCRANRMSATSGYSSNGVQMQYPHPPSSMNTHPSLRSQHSVPLAPFNHQVPYGQGLGGYNPGSGSTARMSLSNGYADVPAVNGTRSSKGYGTSNLRSSVPATHAHTEFGPTAAAQSLTFSHYQPQQRDYYPNPPTVYDQLHSPVTTYDQRTRDSPVDQRLPRDSPVVFDQRQYRDSPAAYGHTNQSYGHYESHNNPRNLSGWNGAPANHSPGYSQTSSTTTFMPSSAERSSVVPESSSRHIHIDQPPNHYPQHHHPHQQQQQQQWLRQGVPQAHMPFAASSASFPPHRS